MPVEKRFSIETRGATAVQTRNYDAITIVIADRQGKAEIPPVSSYGLKRTIPTRFRTFLAREPAIPPGC